MSLFAGLGRWLLGGLRLETEEEAPGRVTARFSGRAGLKLLRVTLGLGPDGKLTAEASGLLRARAEPLLKKMLGVVNNLKVVSRQGGRNWYNLYNAPLPSRAGMRPLERKLLGLREGIVFPATATLAVTPSCQCRCVHCSADRFMRNTARRRTLEGAEVKGVVDQALALGVSTIIYVGGEPLLRRDLEELLAHIDGARCHKMIFTNGLGLTEERVGSLAAAGLASLNISIDDQRPEVHDRLRRVKNCFAEAFAGARRARAAGILTGISTYATPENIASGGLEDLLQRASGEGFHEVTIFDCVPAGRYLNQPEVRLSRADVLKVREITRRWNSQPEGMGVVAQAVANGPEGGGCFGGFTQFFMTMYGDINPCDFNPVTFGNIRERPLADIWRQMVSHPEFRDHVFCCRMQAMRYRRKYIDAIPPEEVLPVPIERLPGDGTLLPESAHPLPGVGEAPRAAPAAVAGGVAEG